MARKKKAKTNNKSSQTRQPSLFMGSPSELGDMFSSGALDRRAMEGLMRQLVAGEFGEEPDNSPLARAQQLIYEAFDSPDPKQQIQLATQALAISPDCADAYVMLGECARSAQEARQLYEQGVAAGRRTLGEDAFEELAGHFWGCLETRPYMRVRLELAKVLLQLGERREAAEHLQDMLRLNPEDNQGVRYILLGLLIELDLDDRASALIEQYPEDCSAEWHYGRALLAFRRACDTPLARTLLNKAMKRNPHVPPYLVGSKHIPANLPPYFSPGEESEAHSYSAAHLRCWKATPGAIPWLRAAAGIVPDLRGKPRQKLWNGFPSEFDDLQQDEEEIWNVDLRHLSGATRDRDDSPWAILVTSPSREQVIAAEFLPYKPGNTEVLQILAKVMANPDDDSPRRPAVLQVRLKTLCKAWEKKLAAVAIRCEHVSQMPDVDMLHEELMARVAQRMSRPGESLLSDDELDELPQVPEELWEADVRQLATWLGDKGVPVRPWLAIVSNSLEGTILAQDMTAGEPDESWFMHVIQQAMSNPSAGNPHRPGTVVVCSKGHSDSLRPWLSDRNIECEFQQELEHMDFLYEKLTRHMCGDEATASLLDAPGVEPNNVAGVFAAAAEFYRQKSWHMIVGDSPIKIECSDFQSSPWYAVVMGQIGMCQGIALYEDYDQLMKMLTGRISDEENARTMSALSLQFNEPFDIPSMDLHYTEKYGWEIAGPEAYPTIMRVNPGMAIRTPLAWELRMMEASLRAVPRFLQSKNKEMSKLTVHTSTGPVNVQISWA